MLRKTGLDWHTEIENTSIQALDFCDIADVVDLAIDRAP